MFLEEHDARVLEEIYELIKTNPIEAIRWITEQDSQLTRVCPLGDGSKCQHSLRTPQFDDSRIELARQPEEGYSAFANFFQDKLYEAVGSIRRHGSILNVPLDAWHPMTDSNRWEWEFNEDALLES